MPPDRVTRAISPYGHFNLRNEIEYKPRNRGIVCARPGRKSHRIAEFKGGA
jgi:hypothetical protein